MTITTGTYDEALERLHHTGPEFDGYLSNHAPMVVELLARRGEDARVHAWTDTYLRRLDEFPRATNPIDAADWRAALGQHDRAADWIALMAGELGDEPWRAVLERWWARLIPGIAAGATHGVIRTGHAVRALEVEETPERIEELAHALGYWAARWLPVPVVSPHGTRAPGAVLAALPRLADQSGSASARLGRLGGTDGWADAAATASGAGSDADIPARLDTVVEAAVRAYGRYADGNPTMLVHAATAPNAVAASLPSLPASLWRVSFEAAWTASAALVAAYAPARPADVVAAPTSPDDVLDRALTHGGEHVLKFADTALTAHDRTSDPAMLTAALRAIDLDA